MPSRAASPKQCVDNTWHKGQGGEGHKRTKRWQVVKFYFKLYLLLPLVITQSKYSPEKRVN